MVICFDDGDDEDFMGIENMMEEVNLREDSNNNLPSEKPCRQV